MQNTNTVTSNATLTPEARGIITVAKSLVTEVYNVAPAVTALKARFGNDAPEAVYYLAGIAEGKHLERQRRADARPLHFTDDTGSRAPLTISEAQQYIDDTALTGDDLTNALNAMLYKVQQNEDVYLGKVKDKLKEQTLTEREKAIACATFFTGFSKAFLMIMKWQQQAIEEITAEGR